MKQYLVAYTRWFLKYKDEKTGNEMWGQSNGIYTEIVEGNSSKEVYETFNKENTRTEIIAISYIGD